MVTAQKRVESLSDVPVSVTALSGNKLADAGIGNLSDLSEYTPNFKMVEGGLIPNVYMRGVGSGSNQGFELSVGIFADGVHLGRPHQTRAAFMDLSRVEVLRGPQSILFGKNAIAGAMSLVSGTPGDEFEALVSGSTGLTKERNEVNAMVSSPITDVLGARFAYKYKGEEGHQKNLLLDRLEPNVREQAMRLTIGYDPVDWLESSLKLEHATRNQKGRQFELTDVSALTECSGEDVELNRRKSSDAPEQVEIESWNATLNLGMPLEIGTFNSVSSSTGYRSSDLFDADSSSFNTIPLLGEETYEQLSQEFRFTSPGGQFIDYIAGVFYQKSQLQFIESSPLTVRNGALPELRNADCSIREQILVEADLARDFKVDAAAVSAFTQLTFNWNKQWRTTVGLRYVNETKDSTRTVTEAPGNCAVEGSCTPLEEAATTATLDALNIRAHNLASDREVSVLLPSVNLQWDTAEDIMSYITFTKGAKSGGYDARGNNDNTDTFGGATTYEYDDENADAWELGAKMRLLEGSAELNIAAYRVEYESMQVSVFDGVSAFVVTNAGSALTQGVELDGRWLLTEWFMLSGSLAYLDFEWLEYGTGPCFPGRTDNVNEGGESCDLSGDKNLQTPRWSGTVSGNLNLPITDALVVDTTLDASYKAEHFTTGDLDPRGIQESYTKYNARVALGASDSSWNVALVGKNLTDELTRGIGAGTVLDEGGFRTTVEPERIVYLEGRYRF